MAPAVPPARTGRAAPMAPDDRRRAILDVTVPLLLEHGAALTTKQVAEAAGIAEGTVFRVFPDKAALLHAAAEDVLAPAGLAEVFAASLDGVIDLRAKVLVATERLHERADKVTAVMMAMRAAFMASDHDHTDRRPRGGPPQYLLDSQHALLELLTRVFVPHADELSVPPRTAALLLRALALGSRHPGGGDAELTPAQITDVLLDGVRSTPRSGR